ncbi:MAG: ribosome rescue protein RqcH [Candidatus Nanohaloarchaea archaeon]
MELTSLELSTLMEEFSELEEGFVQKVYQRGEELTLEIYVPGDEKKRLILGTDRAFISKYKRDNPERPPGFCMELRKHLGKVDSIEQRGFDRILVIESGDKTLIAEIFGKGNFVLLDDDRIIGALREEEWADRTIRVGEDYEYPEPAEDPREADIFELLDEGELVRKLAADASLGGTYAEEVCARADVDKESSTEELSAEEKDRVREAVRELFHAAEEPEPVLYLDQEPVMAAPFPLETYSGHDREDFETFSEALDEYYYRKKSRKREEKREEAYQEKKQGLERQLEQQERKLEGLKKSSDENREKAELIYRDYSRLKAIQDDLKEAVEEHGWKQVAEKIEESDSPVNSVNEREEFASVPVEDKNIKLTLEDDLEAIASRYYDKAKQSESKMESVREAMGRTREKLEELEPEEIDTEAMEDKSRKRDKKWFEKYRWFYSSDGFLVLAGRDSQTNEMLVKKHMNSGDLYLHADFDAAPSVVIKEGQDAPESTLEEAAKFAVTFSSVWKRGIASASTYYVDPEQVTKNPESGEFVGKGAFVIRGEREYIRNVSAEAAIGPYELESTYVPMAGPPSAVEENCPASVEVKQGRDKKSEVAKKIREKLSEQGYDLDLDYIIRALPPGKSRI